MPKAALRPHSVTTLLSLVAEHVEARGACSEFRGPWYVFRVPGCEVRVPRYGVRGTGCVVRVPWSRGLYVWCFKDV